MAKNSSKKQAERAAMVDKSPFWRVVEMLPFFVPAGLVAFSAIAIALLILGQLRSVLVWPLGLIAAGFAVWLVARSANVELPGSIKERKVFGLLAIMFVLLWIGFNARYTAQDVFVYQDPGFYTVAGEWLKNHDNLDIPMLHVFGNDSAIQGDTAGFEPTSASPNRLFVQAPHLLPVLLGLTARVAGTAFMLHTNAIIGGLALLVVYGFARCFMRPRWAFLAMAALAVSLPMIYFSRDTYSEPLDMLLVFGALSLMWLAQKKSSKWLWFLAGLAAAATTMSRIDAYLVVAAFLASVVVLLIVAKKDNRGQTIKNSALFLAGMAITSLLGWLDVSHLSAQYYGDLHGQFRSEILLIVAVAIGGIIAVLTSWHTSLLAWLDKNTTKWRAPFAVALILLIAIIFASRPLWYVGRDTTVNPIIYALQKAAGRTVENRSYAEQTVNWVAWYVGPILSLLGLAGLCLAAYWLLHRRKYLVLLPAFVVITITTLLYLYKPSITPYQIWAARRYLPIVFPGLSVFGALALGELSDKLHLPNVKAKRAVLATIILLIFAAPVFISYPFLRAREYVPELAQVNSVCHDLPKNAAVLVLGSTGLHDTQSVRAFCGVPAMRINNTKSACSAAAISCSGSMAPQKKDLQAAAQAAVQQGLIPIVFVTQDEQGLLPKVSASNLTVASSITYGEAAATLYHPPRKMWVQPRTILLGKLDSSGGILPLK